MLSIDSGRTIKEFVQALRDIGYYCHYEVVNTKSYGVPQNRERIFLVGFLDHEAYHRFSFAPKQKLEKRLKDVLEDDVDEKYYLSDKIISGFLAKNKRYKIEQKAKGFTFAPSDVEKPSSCLNARYYKSGAADIYIDVIRLLDCKGTDQIRRVYGVDGVAATLTTMQGGNQEPKILQLGRGFNNGGEHEVCPTIAINSFEQNNFVSQQRIRKLTPRECLRLQDFPDHFVQVVSDSQMYKQAGNSMSCNVLEMIFRQIEKAKSVGSSGNLF
jgi:DNA (cytosine-5)-methyltransferase 1